MKSFQKVLIFWKTRLFIEPIGKKLKKEINVNLHIVYASVCIIFATLCAKKNHTDDLELSNTHVLNMTHLALQTTLITEFLVFFGSYWRTFGF